MMRTTSINGNRFARKSYLVFINALAGMPLPVLKTFLKILAGGCPYPPGDIFWYKLVEQFKRVSRRLSPCNKEKLLWNFFHNAIVVSNKKRAEFFKREGFPPPWLLVISPTMRCNLRCYGCYAGEYTKKDDLPFPVVSRVIDEAMDMGIYFFTISGGEPFSWEPLLDLCREKSDAFFHIYTNGTLIDRAMAKRLAALGNIIPLISVEGFEEETDARRGPGTFRRIVAAMDNLRDEGVLFGFSATATRANNELIVSDRFIDFYAAKGCFIGWYFNYIPIGRAPQMDLMPTPEQRIYRLNELNRKRMEKDIVLADFWNDGPLVGGCIAGGRRYLHINCRGDVEPCVFCHFATDNIKEKSLVDILRSDLFRLIRERQPFNEDLLRPCMIIDNPWTLRELVERSGAVPTHRGAETIIGELAPRLDAYAREYGELADRIWQEKYRDYKLPREHN